MGGSPFFVGFATFAAVALGSDITLTSQIVFPALSMLNLLTFPLAMLPVSPPRTRLTIMTDLYG